MVTMWLDVNTSYKKKRGKKWTLKTTREGRTGGAAAGMIEKFT